MAKGDFRPIAAYRWTQRSSLRLGLRVGGHLALNDFRSEDPKWTLAYGVTLKHHSVYYYY